MTIAAVGTLGNVGHFTSSSSFTLTTATNSLASGDFGILVVVSDNRSTTDGASNDHTSVSGGTGNWTKLGEYTNTVGGAAADGVCVSAWLFEATGSLAIGSVITMNLSGNATDKTACFHKFTKAAGKGLIRELASPVYNTQDASNGFGSATISGLASQSRLYFRALGKEANTSTNVTPTTGFSSVTGQRSQNATTAVICRGEYRINTSTGETSNPTLAVAGDAAGLFTTLKEAFVLSTGLASETNTALGIGKTKPTGLASETDSAFASTISTPAGLFFPWMFKSGAQTATIVSIGLSSETDTAITVSKKKVKAVALASETDSSFPLSKGKVKPTGLSSETDSSLGLSKKKLQGTGLATSVNTALSLGISNSSNLAGLYFPWGFKSGSSQTLLSAGLSSESNTAYALRKITFKSIGIAVETDVALPLGLGSSGFYLPFGFKIGATGGKFVVTGTAVQVNTALTLLTRKGQLKVSVRWSQETPTASKVGIAKVRSVGLAQSTNTALALTRSAPRSIGLASETDTAFSRPRGLIKATGVAQETDSALQLIHRRLMAYGISNEQDQALTPQPGTLIATGVAVETNTAFNFSITHSRSVGLALETNTSVTCRVSRNRVIGVAVQANQAAALIAKKLTTVKISQSFNTSLTLTRVKVKPHGFSIETDTAKQLRLFARIAAEKDGALFFQIKQGGKVVYPSINPRIGKRFWNRFIA